MNKKFILRKNEEIQNVVKNSSKVANKYYVIYNLKNSFNYNRYCVSVSKKIGKAHTRNLYKRRVKDILSKSDLNFSNDYVIILRNAILDISYDQMRCELFNLLKRRENEK